MGLTLTAQQPTDMALVRATIIPGGATGWHMASRAVRRHRPGRGIDDACRAHHRRCIEQEFAAGDMFEHPKGVHNFIAGAEGVESTCPISCRQGQLRC